MNKVYVLITETYRNGKRVDHLVSTYSNHKRAEKEWQARCELAAKDASEQLVPAKKEISLRKDNNNHFCEICDAKNREEWCISHWIESHKVC